MAAFRQAWLSQGETSEDTWNRHWQRAFDRLPQEEPLDSSVLVSTLLSINPGTRERKRTTGYYKRLAEFAELPIDLSPYRGDYSTGRSEVPRELPSDEAIALMSGERDAGGPYKASIALLRIFINTWPIWPLKQGILGSSSAYCL